jgi:hypothetical protein
LQARAKKNRTGLLVIQVHDLHQFLVAENLIGLSCRSVIRIILNLSELSIMNQEVSSTEEKERIPTMQRIIDNPFLLLFIGVVVPTVFYVLWGIMEIVTIPLAP